jgi:hypothetical protein
VAPPNVRLHAPVIVVLLAPEFCKITLQASGVPEQDTLSAETIAIDVKVPIRPNTKPATATEATRVIAIRITVARTGEIAFRLDFAFIQETSGLLAY